ncbi:MAG: hypothetical protein AB1941_04035 [Gemmatimonadota bacterium]
MSENKSFSAGAGDLRQLSMLADRGSMALALARKNVINEAMLRAGIDFCDALLNGMHYSQNQLDMSRLSRQVAVLMEQSEPLGQGDLPREFFSANWVEVKELFEEILSGRSILPPERITRAQEVLASTSLPFYLADKDLLRATKERRASAISF